MLQWKDLGDFTARVEFSDAVQNGSQGCPDLSISVWDFTQNTILALGRGKTPPCCLLALSLMGYVEWSCLAGAADVPLCLNVLQILQFCGVF